jgi:hypothetical protein
LEFFIKYRLWGQYPKALTDVLKNKAMATEKTRQSKEQSRHQQKINQYNLTQSDKKYIVIGLIILVFIFSLSTQIRAFIEVEGYALGLILLGLGIDIANFFVESAIALDNFARQQWKNKQSLPIDLPKEEAEKQRQIKKNCEFKDLLPIPQSHIKYGKMIWGIRLFWGLGICFVIFMTSNSRNKANNEWIKIEISTLENQQISTNNSTILDENKRREKQENLNNELSLLRKKERSIISEAHGNDWLLRTKYKNSLESIRGQIKQTEIAVKTLGVKQTDAEKDNKKRIDDRIAYLKNLDKSTEGKSDFTRNMDIIVHLALMIISMFAIYFSVKEFVRYRIHSGHYHKIDPIIEEITPSVTDTPKTVIMKQALETVKLKRKGSRGKEKEDVSISDYLGWKNDEQYQRRYREVNKQLKENYTFISGEDGIDRVCPIIKKK